MMANFSLNVGRRRFNPAMSEHVLLLLESPSASQMLLATPIDHCAKDEFDVIDDPSCDG